MLSATLARTRRATWFHAAVGLTLALLLVFGDSIYGWTWWHVGLAAINLGSSVQFARGAWSWHDPRRARKGDADGS